MNIKTSTSTSSSLVVQNNNHSKKVAVIGGGPSGMTIALLLSKVGYSVKLFESGKELGGLWSVKFDKEGYYAGENSCKVYQADYHTAPALLNLIGTKWQDHFTPRHNLRTEWLQPFKKDCSKTDIIQLGFSFLLDSLGLRSYKDISVEEYLEKHNISEKCQAWLRATALGGVTGTLKMSVWELGHRLRSNLFSIFGEKDGTLYWNKQPPNSANGFITRWHQSLIQEGVKVHVNSPITKLTASQESSSKITLQFKNGTFEKVDAAFLAVPPPALSKILNNSSKRIIEGFGHDSKSINLLLNESVYEHLGLVWYFDRPIPSRFPLGGHNTRKGWHPIMVQYPQYKNFLKPPASTVVVGSVSLVTNFRHSRLGKTVDQFDNEEIANIIWEDERLADPDLPEPVAIKTLGLSSATQIVHHGSLPIKSEGLPLYLGTNLNGKSPYFTSSLESAIQAGAAAAESFDPSIPILPTGV